MSTRPPRPLTMGEAARLTRREILDRVEAEQARLLARRSKTPAQHARLTELMRIMRAAGITPEAGLDALERTLAGERDGWRDERPAPKPAASCTEPSGCSAAGMRERKSLK